MSTAGLAAPRWTPAAVSLAVGLWLSWRMMDRQSRVARLLLWEKRTGQDGGRRPRWGLLLLGVVVMTIELLGLSPWFGIPAVRRAGREPGNCCGT